MFESAGYFSYGRSGFNQLYERKWANRPKPFKPEIIKPKIIKNDDSKNNKKVQTLPVNFSDDFVACVYTKKSALNSAFDKV